MESDKLSWVVLPISIFIAVGIGVYLLYLFLDDILSEVINTQQLLVLKVSELDKSITGQSNQLGNLTANLQIETLNRVIELERNVDGNNDTSTVDTNVSMNVIPDENLSRSLSNNSFSSGSISSFTGGANVIHP